MLDALNENENENETKYNSSISSILQPLTPTKSLEPTIKNSLFEGDCLDVLSRFPDASVDMVLCDLPYGTTQNK